jgi:hypothetical protein
MSAQGDVMNCGMSLANINVIGLLSSRTEMLSGSAAISEIRKDMQI